MDRLEIAIDHRQIGVSEERNARVQVRFRLPSHCQGLGDLVGMPDVVLVAEHHVVGAGLVRVFEQQAEVGGGAQSPVAVFDESDSRIAGGEAADDLGRCVGRAIVADEELPVRNGLALETAKLLVHEGGAVVASHHEDEGRLGGMCRRPACLFVTCVRLDGQASPP